MLLNSWKTWLTLAASVLPLATAFGQEQIDKLERQKQAVAALGEMSLRVRITHCLPLAKELVVDWRRGGEGLGGIVIRGKFVPTTAAIPDIDDKLSKPLESGLIRFNEWSCMPAETICGKAKGWEFPTVTVNYPASGKSSKEPPTEISVEFEFSDRGKVFRTFTEIATKGATVGFAFPGGLLDQRGAANPEFAASLQGLFGHAHARRERLEKLFPETFAPPSKFGVIGHLGGYGQGPGAGLHKAIGFGTRHCNPAILAEECRTLQLLGMNGMVDKSSLHLADECEMGKSFRRVYWGSPGSGSPMAAVSSKTSGEPDGCPFDPRLKATMSERVTAAIAEHQATGATEKWALWWDEIGVAAKEHINQCPQCRAAFQGYLRQQQVQPAEVGAKNWEDVAPYPLWKIEKVKDAKKQSIVEPPDDAAGRLRYYYTYRFMTHATANLFPDSAKRLQEAGIWLYAMQGPTPSWSGSSLDWHEFYDRGANRAIVWETSNRDPRSWQWESYLGDIARGISRRHDLPIGCLVKPHRGAPQQRMLSVVSRGTRALEWYTYGPDYSKGDSFSQSPQLLEDVARAGRFLARSEKWLYEAKWAGEPEVAFVFPRSSEIWQRANGLGVTPLENAKWVYLALQHAHIPLDILSEQQLAEGVSQRYKVLYVVGPNLRRDATAKVAEWVRAGGMLWTDAIGMSRDEANQPNIVANDLLNVGTRHLESWGKTPEYRATTVEPLVETMAPAAANLTWKSGNPWGTGEVRAMIGRERLAASTDSTLARFSDDSPAVVQRKVGRGQVTAVGLWAGLTYSARVRRADFDMQKDFDPVIRRLIVAASLEQKIYRPALPENPLVEAVYLKNEAGHSLALMNWSYRRAIETGSARSDSLQTLENLTIELSATFKGQRVRSLQLDLDLPVTQVGERRQIVLPKLATIDLLVVDAK